MFVPCVRHALTRAKTACVEDFRPTAELVVERAAGAEACPDSHGVSDAVGARLGYDPFRPSGDLRIRVRFGREAGGLAGVVEAFDPQGEPKGEKEIASKDCAET